MATIKSIEEKAKRYDEALKAAIVAHKDENRHLKATLERIFPELKESDDELHRKWILEYLYDGLRKSDEQFKGHFKAAIAWFEKQGEHAKFCDSIQVGDKVTRNEDGVLVNLSQLKRVAKKDEKQGKNNMGISEATKKKLEDNLNKALEKETPESCNEFLEKQGEQKSDTDFSDLRTWKYIVDAVWTEKEGIGQYLDSPFTEEVAKKLQKRFGKIEQKPTDKVEPKFKVGDSIRYKNSGAIFTIKSVFYDHYSLTNNEGLLYFKFQDKYELVEQKPAEWSEEDEKMIRALVSMCDVWATSHQFYPKENKEMEALKTWLKSLRPQSQWKPSDGQMEALRYVTNFDYGGHKATLVSLYEQLKKLKG